MIRRTKLQQEIEDLGRKRSPSLEDILLFETLENMQAERDAKRAKKKPLLPGEGQQGAN